jgi:large subunit ribosomal protein L13
MERKLHKIDAEGKVPGRLASEIAILLHGKHRVDFQPDRDMGDIVEVSNYAKVKFTGNKMEGKKYYRHTGYIGGIKESTPKKKLEEDPKFVLWNAVFHMLPKNKLRKGMIKRLKFVD